MFSIFKKKSPLVTDLNWLGVDIHSHLLPGIDDGAKDLQESLSYIKRMEALGFSKLICTPHIFTELYPNNSDTISTALEKVSGSLLENNIGIEIEAAAEYMIDDSFLIVPGHLCLPGGHSLIEMSYLSEMPGIEQVIFNLQILGYKIVLAHPERYLFYHKSLQRYQRLKDMGCLFQLNLLAVTGYYGKEVKYISDYLLKKNLYDVAGTDTHHNNHLRALEKSVETGNLYKALGGYEFKNKSLFLDK